MLSTRSLYVFMFYYSVRNRPSMATGGYSRAQQEQHQKYLQKLHKDFAATWNYPCVSNADVSHFKRLTLLGAGAYGIVFLVKHYQSGKYFAMKMLEKEKILKKRVIDYTYNEKEILCGLNFPFVVHMIYYFKDNVYINFVMPFIAGGEMFTHIQKLGRFNESLSKFYTGQVILALEYLHACDLVHRDLKPENILIDRTGYIKLTDFGFCKLLTRPRTWTFCGTPDYVAPEIILSKGYGLAVDWWSMGVLLFEMNAGHTPFHASDHMTKYEKIVSGRYRCPAHFSPDLINLIDHILQQDISRRYGNLKDGVLDFKNHKWFREINWDNLFNMRIQPPYIPKVRSSDDTSNFYVYKQERIKVSPYNLHI